MEIKNIQKLLKQKILLTIILLRKELAKYNVIVDDVQLVHFDFSPEFNKAIEAKQTEVQNALKAKNILDRIKIESEQKIVQAKAEAETIRIQTEAIKAQGGQEYVQLKAISKWDGKLPQTVTSDNAMLMISIQKEFLIELLNLFKRVIICLTLSL